MTFTPTPEQRAIVCAARDTQSNLFVRAYAGCTKTTTMELVANAMDAEPSLAVAFNVKIKVELEKRFPSNFTVMTLNGLGYRAWCSALGARVAVDQRKLGKLITEALKRRKDLADEWATIRQLVTAAQQAGLVPSHFPQKGLIADTNWNWMELIDDSDLTTDIVEVAREVLIASIKQAHGTLGAPSVSFDDQIYMSTMFGGNFPRFARVIVDEAQDLSPLNHIQIRKSAAGRLFIVGDPMQAIYAFRGADSASMAKLKALRDNWIELPLATTFRCPKAIVQRQQRHAPGFTAAASAPEGRYEAIDMEGEWTWASASAHADGRPIAVLCRNNAPLLSLAFKLIRQRIGVVMLGREIGKGLQMLAKKLFAEGDDSISMRAKIEHWAAGERALAVANRDPVKAEGITDRMECLIAVIDSGAKSPADLQRLLEDLFSRENGQVTLATGHKAKGLEWHTVLHLDPWRIPSKQARTAEATGNSAPIQQERNLRYVIETRSQHTLLTASLETFRAAEL